MQKPTNRQLEFLSLIASGRSTYQIADEIGVSQNTVRNTIVAAKEKSEASSTANLIAYSVYKGWIWPVDDGVPAEFAVIPEEE
jgi:DNA-binding NarL/FixJ family response regulator